MVRPIGPETPKEMAPLPGYDSNAWSDEHDCVPLKHRLKMLLAAKRLSDSSDTESGKARKGPYVPPVDDVKKEDQQCRLQEERNWMFSPEQSQTGMLGDNSSQGTEGNEHVSSNVIKSIEANCETAAVEKVDACASSLIPCSVLSMYHVKAEVDYLDYNLTTSRGNGVEGALGTKVRAVNLRKEIDDVFVDDLDHIVLKERRRLLVSRKSSELRKTDVEGNNSSMLNSVVGHTIRHSISREKKRNGNCDEESLLAGSHTHRPAINASCFNMTSESGKSEGIIAGSSSTILNCSSSMQSCQGIKYAKPGFTKMKENDRTCPSKKASITNTSFGRHDFASNPRGMLGLASSSTFVNIKAEPLEHVDAHKVEKDAAHSFPSNCIGPVKSELEVPEAFYGDEVDHMLLRDRIKLLASQESPRLDSSRKFECLKKTVPCVVDCSPIASEFAKPIRINRRKKRRTATDSVETAMEEDAPGLLQVLIEKGVLVNEIKLYGEPESGEAIDDSEDSFSELEAVVSKLFSHRQSQLKLPPLRCTKAEKASYCLACLISLVEQARYLQFLKWPVEWGWCRDLQSFIFVFERHNRIVLERPEYGFATYFFELVDSVPVHWQIKRLVTAMKLTSCSRVTLIENKVLMVGEDLTEGEARVLTEYGWIPNTGLGTMLNYCERVVHNRKNETDSSEWKSKIGKLLMNGYNGGTIVTTDVPKKVIGYSGAQGSEIKLEL